jgi:2-C-methyl-D-erythritol 2,4-cyclodiphosphate synthase
LETDPENIAVKATTAEKLGFIGREEGIMAIALVLLSRKQDK